MRALRTQKIVLWWSIVLGAITAVAIRLVNLLPMPSPRWSSAQIAQYYVEHGSAVRLGAMLGAWVGGFVLLWGAVVAVQIYRHERGGAPIWTIVFGMSSALVTIIFVAMPTNFLGVAAYAPDRAPDTTALMHQLGMLTFIASNQWMTFLFISIAVICLTPNAVRHSPFPRWFGYYILFALIANEMSSVPFITHMGPFAWNGLLGYWVPVANGAVWISCSYVLLLKAINAQMREEMLSPAAEVAVA